MTSASTTRIRVATLNCQHTGWAAGMTSREVDNVVAAVDGLGPAPHILALSGTIGMQLFSNAALLALTRLLNKLLPDNDFYYPFLSERPGSRNPPGLWLSARHIDVVADHQMPHPGAPRLSHEVYHHTVEAFIAGRRVWLKAVQWQEPDSPQGPVVQSVIDSQLAMVPAILLGDFAASIAADEAPGADWAERRANIDALERVQQAGFWDAGRVAAGLGEGSGASGGRSFDHIFVSNQAPARLVPGSYAVGLNKDGMVHAGVACDLDFDSGPATEGRGR